MRRRIGMIKVKLPYVSADAPIIRGALNSATAFVVCRNGADRGVGAAAQW